MGYKNPKLPEELNSDTPQWFKDWHNQSFWHFKYEVNRTLAFHSKILWTIISLVLTGMASLIVRLWTGL